MSPFPIRKLLIPIGSVVGVLIAALLVLPFLIDLNSYKPQIIAEVKQATGRDLAIAGSIRLSLLPLPVVTLDGVSFANPVGAKSPNMAEVKSVTVWLSLPALLTGAITASEVTLVAARVNLEIDATGQPNWAFAPSAGAGGPLPVTSFRVEGGTLSFSDARTGLSVSADRLDLSASATSMTGPVALAGSGSVDDAPLKFSVSLRAKMAAGHDVDLTLDTAGGKLAYKGTVSELGPDARLSGTVSASAENMVVFVRALARIAGQPRPHVPPLLAGKFRFEGPVALSRTDVSARDFTLMMGDDKLSGSLTAKAEPVLSVDARLSATRVDLDRWLKAIVLPAEVKAAAKAAEEAAPPPPLPTVTSTAPREPNWLVALNAKLALDVGVLIYNRQSVRNIAVEIEARNGAIAVPKFTIDLPGDFVVRASSTLVSTLAGTSARPRVSGELSLEGPKLRETLAWLQVDTSAIPADKLTRVSMRGRMGSRDGDVLVEGTSFELDTLKGRAGITVAFTIPLSVELRLELVTVDLDAFVPPPGQAAAATSPTSAVVPILALLGPSLGLKLKVARVDYRGEVVSGIDLDVARQAGTLKLNDLKVASLAGARLDVRGAVADYWTPLPRANVVFTFETPDIDRVLKLAGAPPTGFGSVSAAGDVAGTWESLAIRRGSVSAMGATVQASGALALLGVTDGKIASMSYKGSVVADGQPMTVAISADHLAGRPHITADLKVETFEFDKFFRGRSAPRPYERGRAAASDEIDTASFRKFDGTFRLATAALGGAQGRLGNADIAAELKDGKLTLTHLKGALYGGALNLSGVVDATQPALSFHLKGTADGLRIGEMMRASSGTNEVGSMIKVALDGVLNANDIMLSGSGTTAAGLKASLAGGARLGGHVYPSANRFLQMIGAAAAGATGGAIDFTLGNIASLFGERGGIGVGNILNAVSLVLNRFVNHDDPISGGVEISHSMLSDRDLRLQGSGATASIHTRTSLENATTETTIDFFLAEEPSLPYLIMSVRGPLAGPSFSATRGGAKDPPGMTSIIKEVEKVPSMLPSIPMPSFHIPNPFGR
ncbi:MAG: AsmA family protein [Reyranella sp.]|nr:AsmA family protein [Reyranella sp.]